MNMKKNRSKAETNDALQSILGGTDSEKKPRSKGKKRVLSIVAIVLVAAIGSGVFFLVHSKQANNQPVYREYTVQRGDIMVGLTESSVITLNKGTVAFPVGAEVLELYVKSGA